MTVHELILKLQAMPPELPVYVVDTEGYFPDYPMLGDPFVAEQSERPTLPKRVVIK